MHTSIDCTCTRSIGRPRAVRHHWTALFLFVFTLGLLAQSATAQETVAGTVTNAATGRTLQGARVVLTGTGRETVTDGQGEYRFSNVAPGSVTLSVSYTGLNTLEVPVVVATGGANRGDVKLTADIYTLSKFVVSGEREGNAQAITLQRQSNGVKNIASTDAFGSLPGNPAELALRLPGVEGVACDGDTRYLRIRGMSSNLSSITQDGNRLADAASAGTTREYQFQQVGSDAIERVEVVKSPTPDMDGDSIGGNVNMVTKSAFDSSPERRIRASFGVIWRGLDARERGDRPFFNYMPRNYALSYSEVFGGKFGVTLNIAYRGYNCPEDEVFLNREQMANGNTGPDYIYQVQYIDFRLERARSGGGLRFDYKLSDNSRFFASASMNKILEHFSGPNAIWSTNQGVATRDAAGNLTGTNGIEPGYTSTLTRVRAVPNSLLTLRAQNAYKDGKTVTFQFNGIHRYKNLDIDYDIYQSDSKTNYAGQRNLDFIERGVGFAIDSSANPFYPTVTQTAGPDWTQLSSYGENKYTVGRTAGWDHYVGASVNLKKQFETAAPTYIKMGVRARQQTRRNFSDPWSGSYVGPDGVMGLNPATGKNDDNLAQFGQAFKGRFYTDRIKYPSVPTPAFAARQSNVIDDLILSNPSYFARDTAANVQTNLTGFTTFKEDINAYYMMGNIDLGKLSILGGFRVESTKNQGTGALQVVTPEEKARRAAWVGVVTDAETFRRNTEEYSRRQTRTGENRVVLPGLHFKYSPIQKLVVRASYATNIGRAGIGQLIPRTTVNYDNLTVSSSNPSLKAQTANNFDVTAEYYFEPAGLVSAGVFLKELRNFIYSTSGLTISPGADNGFDGQYVGYTYSTQLNGGFAKVKGLELNYVQQLAFLPGFWSGFNVFANATLMKAEGNYGAGSAIALAPNPKIAGFNPITGNVGVSYIRGKLTLRMQANHRHRYLNSFSTNDSRLRYTSAFNHMDFKSQYRISKAYEVYLDVNNVTNARDNGTDWNGRAGSILVLSPQFFFGINARM